MKSLWLIRHAKSSWTLTDLHDSYRPLNERGYRDAQEMSLRLKKAGVKPDLIVSSHGVRALSTALIFARQLGYAQSAIRIVERLYESTTTEYMKTIGEFPNEVNTVLLFGHNPTISDTVNLLTGAEGMALPTTGIAKIVFKHSTWMECADQSGKLELLDYPKNGTSP